MRLKLFDDLIEEFNGFAELLLVFLRSRRVTYSELAGFNIGKDALKFRAPPLSIFEEAQSKSPMPRRSWESMQDFSQKPKVSFFIANARMSRS